MKIYPKFRYKVVKLSNYETASPNFPVPSAPITLLLINLKIKNDFRLFNSKQ